MDADMPFCSECGRIGARLSGLHPGDAGIVRWTLYACGHVATEIAMVEASTDGASMLIPDAAAAS
jgi:hypothetical protein